MSLLLKAEVRKFCETTSVRGVSRIIKSKSTGLFIIWLLAVLTCAGLLIWQLTVVFKRYASYPVNTLLVQAPYWKNATFPDITICNTQPLIHEKDMKMSYEDYISSLNYFLTSESITENIGSRYNMSYNMTTNILKQFKDPSGYYNNFLIQADKSDADSPILASNYFDWDYAANTNDTYFAANFEPIFDPDYYKCYTAKLDDMDRQKYRAFSGVLYEIGRASCRERV